jgi:ABC-type polysaccharide/polyol phosphate transport system ATPase subunit
VIEIIDVSKKFRIWEDRSRDLKETTINFLRGKKRSFREVWALQKIDLVIKEGETVAFIGENGSGKSTLLKLLGGIYSPDKGRIVTRGKISTLFELGVGFHPDLTGEENIYLNGAMLGFDRAAMLEKFDAIVSFSEIGDFIYSPIRTYSSGMLMRLGFSVAMCVNPDILLLDEVLAVGDEAFQNKCLERLETFKTSGKTIVLVSHGMEMVQKFCERAILLHEGRVVCDDVPKKTIEAYHETLYGPEYLLTHPPQGRETVSAEGAEVEVEVEETPSGEEAAAAESPSEETARAEGPEKSIAAEEAPHLDPTVYQRHGTLEAEVKEATIHNGRSEEKDSFVSGETFSVRLRIRCNEDLENPTVGMMLTRFDQGGGVLVYNTNTLWRNIKLGELKKGEEVEVHFDQTISLPEGTYYLNVGVADSEGVRLIDWHENLKAIRIESGEPRWEGTINLNSKIRVFRSSSVPPLL